MTFNVFGWLRRKAAEAVIGGVADGLRAVTPEGEESPADLDELRLMLAAAVEPKALGAGKDDDEVGEAESRPVAKAAARKK